MLLIDGVRYQEWTPEGEKAEQELENMVKEHAQDIFGKDSIYFDIKHKLKSKAGTGTIPDGYVITFGDKPQLHIIEIELSSHSYDHIISQILKIITCIKDSSTWNETAKTIRDEITKDEFIAIKAKKAIESGEVYEFLYDRISNLASLAIVIDKNREDVREGIKNITHREIAMIEFRTFASEEVGLDVHVHLFEPLCKPAFRREEPHPKAGGGKIYPLNTNELLAKYGDRPSNVEGMTWQQLYDGNTDGNFRFFKVRKPLIELDKRETLIREGNSAHSGGTPLFRGIRTKEF